MSVTATRAPVVLEPGAQAFAIAQAISIPRGAFYGT